MSGRFARVVIVAPPQRGIHGTASCSRCDWNELLDCGDPTCATLADDPAHGANWDDVMEAGRDRFDAHACGPTQGNERRVGTKRPRQKGRR